MILHPKSPLRLTFIGAALVVLAGTTQAQNSLEDCVSLADPAQRLACFDGVMAARSGTPATVRTPATPAAPQPALATSPAAAPEVPAGPAVSEQDFGLELRRRGQIEDAERSLLVRAARHNDFTGWTIEFDDGSIWKQIGTDRYDIEVGKSYTIRRGSLNSYQLGNPDNNRKIRVRREE